MFHRNAYLYLEEKLKLCKHHYKESPEKVVEVLKKLRHIIRSGRPGTGSLPRFAAKPCCGYLCRLRGDACRDSFQVLAYVACTQTMTAVKLDANKMVYNVCDSQLENQRTFPVVTDGKQVFMNHKDFTILTWG